MTRWLLGLVPVVIVLPHLIPLDLPGETKTSGLSDFKDDGKNLPTAAQLEALGSKDPIAFLKFCLRRQEREVQGYSLMMHKQERIAGNLEKKELIEVHFKEDPHSVLMRWKEGGRLVQRALFVEGENNGKAICKPAGLGGFLKSVERDPEGKDARKAGRYTLKEFGLKLGLLRTLGSWEQAKKDDALHVEYFGKKKVAELNDRECYVFKRTRFKEIDAEGVAEQTAYLDAETWLLTGTILKGTEGQLIAEYYFRDVRLNPPFDKDQFTRKTVEAR